jgi:RTX calcium-binding nonapeptide repeat (4 copies)
LTEFDESRHNECTRRSPVGARSCTGRDTMRGGEGEDRLEGANEGDSLHGNEGADLLIGYAGNDVVRGGPDADRIGGFEGNDRLMGNSGDDEIDSAFFETPGSRDTVSCGRGRDEVIANRNDVVRGDCERVDRRPNPTVPPFSGDGGSAGSSRSFAADLEKAREEFLAKNKPSG